MRNLFFWRGIEEAAFKPTDGGFGFYPYGALGGGYVVTTEQKAELGALLRRFYLLTTIVFLVQIVTGPLLGFLAALAVAVPLVALLYVYLHLGMRAHLAGAPRAAERLSLREAQRRGVATMSNARIIVTLVAGALLVAGSLILLLIGMSRHNGEATLYGGLGTVFFGLMFLSVCYSARLKWGVQS